MSIANIIPLAQRAVDNSVSEITNKIPIPIGPASKYPLAQLEVGESFSCPANRRASIRTYICAVRKAYPGRQFIVRSEPVDRIRIWRTQ
jgi:hypothetical protein